MIRAVPGWMCQVDFDYELGEAAGGTRVFSSEYDLHTYRKCTAGDDEDHTPCEVVVLSKEDFDALCATSTIDFSKLYSSNVGPVIWTKESGFVGPVC